MKETANIIEIENLSYSYVRGQKVMDELGFSLAAGEKVGLIGDNGSGKSTLMHMIMGLMRPMSGTIRLFGKEMAEENDFKNARKKIGLLFQNADDQLFSPTVLEDVAFGPLNLGKSPAEARDMSLAVLEKLELKGFEDRITHRLSGGEKKLVALATILVMEPRILLLDEPTTGLDAATRERIIQIMGDLDITCLIVSHEFDYLVRTTNTIYCMKNGRIEYNCASEDLHSHYHSHTAGHVPHKHS